MAINHYFKYRVPYQLIFDKLNSLDNITHLNIFIDLPSIARGLYSKTTQHLEINKYLETREMPTLMIDELREFLNNMYRNFKGFNVKFIIFFDNGKALQTKSLSSDYKADRSAQYGKILEDEEREIHRAIRAFYYTKIKEILPRKGLCAVVYDLQYEMDCLPHFCLSRNLFNCADDNTVNLILSSDKDLLQTCDFKNTFQVTSIYSKQEVQMNVWDDESCLKYIYPKFLRGKLTAKHLPLLLAISGDKADGISNCVRGMGIAHAVELVTNNDIPPIFNDGYTLPYKLEPYKDKILSNLNLTSFDLQIKNIPEPDLIHISNQLSILD